VISNATLPAHRRERVPCAQILRDAAQYLAEHGWFQGDMFAAPDQPTSRACALGAIRMSTVDVGTEFVTAARVFADFLVRNLGASDPDRHTGVCREEDIVSGWNDDPDRLVSEVIAALCAAAEEWDRIIGGAA
jgi:hypothetical protein